MQELLPSKAACGHKYVRAEVNCDDLDPGLAVKGDESSSPEGSVVGLIIGVGDVHVKLHHEEVANQHQLADLDGLTQHSRSSESTQQRQLSTNLSDLGRVPQATRCLFVTIRWCYPVSMPVASLARHACDTSHCIFQVACSAVGAQHVAWRAFNVLPDFHGTVRTVAHANEKSTQGKHTPAYNAWQDYYAMPHSMEGNLCQCTCAMPPEQHPAPPACTAVQGS